MFYSDEMFAAKVNDKVGNVRFYKKGLRDRGMIGSRQQLSDDHMEDFKKIQNVKSNTHCTWSYAIDNVLGDGEETESEDTLLLQEILETLKRIENKMG